MQDKLKDEDQPATKKELDAVADAAAAAAQLAKTIKGAPEKLKALRLTIRLASSAGKEIMILIAILLLAFIVHQLFLWVDRDPEIAFERAATLFEVAEVVWDTQGIVWNAATDVINAGVIPLWNSVAFYVAEPVVILVLEIFMLVFTQKHYEGVYSEADFPYVGLDCTKTYEASEFCGRYAAYAARLETAEKAPYFVNETQGPNVGVNRRLVDAADPERVYTFGIATARRLSELADDKPFVAPTFKTKEITNSLDDASSIGITIGAPVADVGTSVAFNVLQSSFSAIMDAIFLMLKSLLEALRWVIKSGLLTTIINIGVEFAIILLTEIAIPSLFAAINALMCIIDLFQPSTWNEQFECSELLYSNSNIAHSTLTVACACAVENRCFRGPDALADLLTFTSVPLALTKFASILESTMNSRTARRFFQPNAGFSTKGRTRRPGFDSQNEVIDNEEPESDADRNPAYEFTFAQDFEDFLPTTGAEQCGGCFVCKFPEFRLVFLLVTSIASLFSEGNYLSFAGNVTQNCMGGGRWYERACGPRGAELLSHETWLNAGYTAGYERVDARIFTSFASVLIKRRSEIGPDERFGPAFAAAEGWFRARDLGDIITNDELDAEERQKAAVFTQAMCRLMRSSDIGEEQDEGPAYIDHASGDLGRIGAEFLYTQCATFTLTYSIYHPAPNRFFWPLRRCKRFKHNTFGDVNRFFHDLTYEVSACAQDKVQCDKTERRCLGLCSGVDNSEFKHDFHTMVALTELSVDALGDQFDSATANCTIKTTTLYVPTFNGGDRRAPRLC